MIFLFREQVFKIGANFFKQIYIVKIMILDLVEKVSCYCVSESTVKYNITDNSIN